MVRPAAGRRYVANAVPRRGDCQCVLVALCHVCVQFDEQLP